MCKALCPLEGPTGRRRSVGSEPGVKGELAATGTREGHRDGEGRLLVSLARLRPAVRARPPLESTVTVFGRFKNVSHRRPF